MNLTTIGPHTAFNNKQSTYRTFSYKKHRNDDVKQFKRENYRPYLCTKNERKTYYVTHKQPTTTRLKVPDLEQTGTYKTKPRSFGFGMKNLAKTLCV